MQAYYNDPSIKESLINQLQAHYDADEIIKGVYWKDGKGCSIGCAIHSNNHKLYEEKFNIPEWLAILQDSIFEGLPNDKAKEWPILFSKSINLGSNLENIKIPFLIFVVESVIDKFNHDEFPDVKKAIDSVLRLLKNSPSTDVIANSWSADAEAASRAASRAADSPSMAADSAWGAADSDRAAACWGAAYAARATSWAADSAKVAWAASRAAGWAAGAAGAAGTAWDAWDASAEGAAYEKFADKLIQLIVDCK